MRLGIDFGTSYSSAAYLRGGHPVAVKPMKGQSPSVPSIVAVGPDGQLQVGHAAAHARADRSVREFKQHLGDEWPLQVAGRELRPAELIARLLAYLREAVPTADGSPDAAVLTVPASYGPHRRELMRLAGQAAGFADVDTVEEPIAAAHYYASEGALRAKDGDLLVVYDLGGGTFDIALLQAAHRGYETIGYAGLPDCGGIDFDTCLYEDIKRRCQRFRELLDIDIADHNAWVNALQMRLAVREFCSAVKHLLSELDEHDGIIPGVFPPEEYRLTRGEFEKMIAPLIDETIELSDGLVRDAELTWRQVSTILLVGGSCRIPYIRSRLKQLNERILYIDDLDLAVAYGAAIYGQQLDKPHPQAAKRRAEPKAPRSQADQQPTAPSPAKQQQGTFDVILTGTAKTSEAQFKIAEIYRAATGRGLKLGLREAVEITKHAPLIKADVGRREAEKLKAHLEHAGGTVLLNHHIAPADRRQAPAGAKSAIVTPAKAPWRPRSARELRAARTKNRQTLERRAGELEKALRDEQRQWLLNSVTGSEELVALCRCAREGDLFKRTVLLLTTERLAWCHETVWRGTEYGNAWWAEVKKVNRASSDGFQITTQAGNTFAFNTFIDVIRFDWLRTYVNGGNLEFKGKGLLRLVRRLWARR